jgi:trehalose 6-phosphate synthase/phosphatase
MITSDKKLFVVSNRLPFTIKSKDEKVEVSPSSGGLITAVNSFLKNDKNHFSETNWVGVPGCSPSVWSGISRQLPTISYNYIPVMLYKEQYQKYYLGFSNSVLWPLFHYFPSYAEYEEAWFDDYMLANQHFADVLLRKLRPGDTVWIHDYHLLPLAGILRKALPELTIGFFLHIPFPSYELFRLLPRKWQQQLLEGMLGADLIGFHTIDYASHFMQSVQMVLGLDNERHITRYKNRLVKVDVFPISIDYAHFNSAYSREEVVSLREHLHVKLPEVKIIFSVDRLDYTKGVQNRLKSFERFLKDNPEYIGKVIFIMVILPSRDTIEKYIERRRAIEELVSRINSTYGTLQWQPVNYRYNFLEFDQMIALYSGCDLALITPLRDGMNLVAKEFIASRKDGKGVLILSEMAGAARELTDALIINPNDITEIAEKLKEGLEMPVEEQQSRIMKMQQRVENYDVKAWAEDLFGALDGIKRKQENFQIAFLDDLSKRDLLHVYSKTNKRLLLLDYDGTLVPFASTPEKAEPGPDLLQLLEGLSASVDNDVFLISGRSSEWLEKYFGNLPLNLVAEHGAKSKYKNSAWLTEIQTHSEWKEEALNIMEMFVRRCPGSFIEEKDFSIVWHYRNCNREQGRLRAIELKGELQDFLRNNHLQVLPGNKVIEVRNSGIDKGTAIKKILSRKEYDYIFAVGDDRTDEDMFRLLLKKKNCFSIKVGNMASYAKYNLLNQEMVLSLLKLMSHYSLPKKVSAYT